MTGQTKYTDVITQVANNYVLPADLLEAQVVVESSGDAQAFRFEPAFFQHYIRDNVAAKAAIYGPLAACSFGLMQIMLEVAMELGYADRPELLFVPRVGLAWGAKKMQTLWKQLGTDDKSYYAALAAYNGGLVGNTRPPFRNASYATHVYNVAGKPIPLF